MNVYLSHIITESADHYYFITKHKPSKEEMIERVYSIEKAAELDFYLDTTSVFIKNLPLEE